MLAQRQGRCVDVVQMLYLCFVFAGTVGPDITYLASRVFECWFKPNVSPSPAMLFRYLNLLPY